MAQDTAMNRQVRELIARQLDSWPRAGENYRALSGVETREVEMEGFPVKIQFNPARIVSSAAKVDDRSVQERKCFLCGQNRPDVQEGIDWSGEAGEYTILLNPFPIFPKHLTIPDNIHTRQQIRGRYADMLDLAYLLDEYVLFYNGPKCGASAPDHMHFQAGNKGFLPLEARIKEVKKELLAHLGKAELFAVKTYMTGVLLIESFSREDAAKLFDRVYSVLPVKEGEWEPMLNILTWCEKAAGPGKENYSVKENPPEKEEGGEEKIEERMRKTGTGTQTAAGHSENESLCRKTQTAAGFSGNESRFRKTETAEVSKWYTLIFLREKHRPSHYFAQGEENILLSPASVDLGGVFITPLEKDFRKIGAKELQEILDEIAVSCEETGRIESALKRIKYESR